MRLIDQKAESKQFIATNKDAIDIQFSRLKEMASNFLNNTAKAYYENALVDSLQSALSNGDLWVFAVQVRSNHLSTADEFDRNRFWFVIDAINAFFDAIGSYWPYVTQEVRAARLGHSKALLEAFQANVWE